MNSSDLESTLNDKRSGVAIRALVSGIAGVTLALTGCASELAPGDALGGREVIERRPEILGTFETRDGVRLTFTAEHERDDGSDDPVMAITEEAPGYAPSYLDHFRSLEATSLEAFLALAPQGTEAPAQLRDAHAREAALLGRSAEPRELSLDSVTSLTTTDSPECDGYNDFLNSVSSWDNVQTDSSLGLHSVVLPAGPHIQGKMCNYTSNSTDFKQASFCRINAEGDLICDDSTLVPDGHRVTRSWYNHIGSAMARVVMADLPAGSTESVFSFLAIGNI